MGPFDMNYEDVANGAILNKKKPGSAPDAQGISAPPSVSSAPVIAAPQAINSIASAAPSVSLGSGQKPSIFDNGGLPADVVQRGIDTMRSQMATPESQKSIAAPSAPIISSAQSPVQKNVIDTSSGPTVSDGAGGVYTPERGSNPIASAINMFKDSAQAARGEKSYEQIRAEREAAAMPASVKPVAPGATQPVGQFQTDLFASASKPDITDGSFITGKTQYDASGLNKTGVAMPDSSGGGFTAGNTSYNVNKTSQDGITKVTAQGKNPLYTNINPEAAVSGLNNQMIGGDPQEGIARMARANATRQEMIDAQPVGGGNILPDQNAIDNAEKTARWRQDDLVYQARQGNQAAIASIINANSAAATEASRANTEAGKTAVAARGQDVQAKSEAARIAGNPQEQQLKQAQAQGIMAQTESAQMLADIQKKALAGDPQAMASYRALTQKSGTDYKDRYIQMNNRKIYNDMGQIVGEESGGLFDAATGKPVDSGAGQPKQGGAPKFSSPADVAAAKAAGTIKSGDVIETPNGLIKVK